MNIYYASLVRRICFIQAAGVRSQARAAARAATCSDDEEQTGDNVIRPSSAIYINRALGPD